MSRPVLLTRASRLAVCTLLAAAGAGAACGGAARAPIGDQPPDPDASGAGDDAGSPDAPTDDAASPPADDASGGQTRDAGPAHKDAGSKDAGGKDASKPDAAAGPCKRGVAMNSAPSNSFLRTGSSPGVAWWYDWSNLAAGGGNGGVEFVPMIWGMGAVGGPIPAGSHFLLGFNEPNFSGQANMTPQQAALHWPAVEALANAQGIPIVSPAVNFCGSPSDTSGCADPTITDPYTYLKKFFAACSGCEVDYIAVHWYNCDLPSLQAFIEGNSTLEGFVQFGKPIWLTEFSCDGSHSEADQLAYMQAAVPYLESDPHVYRYSWFSATAIPSSVLSASDGSLTPLGQAYVSLPQTCR